MKPMQDHITAMLEATDEQKPDAQPKATTDLDRWAMRRVTGANELYRAFKSWRAGK
jgi:hypothetical protein